MKNILKYITAAVAAVAVFACTPSYPELSKGSLPQASDFKVKIDVDQKTNMVTFNLQNQGMVPVWIFGSDQLIDGKQNKKYSYTGNGVQLRFREAGTYSVEVKAYNTFGTSVGSVVEKFTLDNTYRDPFDPTPYIRAISGGASQDWVWNSTEAGHFGCGPVGNPLGWWSCEANGKAGFLYDDILTFDNEGNYTFDPGDGQAYAKKDSEYPAGHEILEDDYLFPAEKATSKFTFENNWNDEGIEEVYLVLDPGSILSYVVHKSLVDNPRYLVMEKTTSKMKKKLELMATASTPANADGISYALVFVPKGSVAGKADPLFGTESKTWVYDNDSQGYLGCGGSVANPVEWWNGAPHDKDAYGVKDDELTFFKDGKYVFDPGADGVVYCNWESEYHKELWSGVNNDDYDAPAEKQESTYTLGSDADGDYIELPAGIFFGYVPNKAVLTEPTHLYIKENTETKLVVVAKFNGISWQMIFRPKEGQEEADPLFDKVSKTWVMANDVQGYMGCGPDFGNPTGWWNGAAHDKDAFGVTDDEITFFADGKYVFDPGADGKVYVNKGSGYHAELLVGDEDYDAPAERQESTYTLGEDDIAEYIELPAGILFGYIPHPSVLDDEPNRLYIKELTKDRLTLVAVYDGIAWQLIFRPKDGGSAQPEPAKDLDEVLVGSWTWDADQKGHFGCGETLANPLGWWNGDAHCKDDAFMYNDIITFTADGKYTLDPVDGKSYINKGVTVYESLKNGECPYGDDFVIAIDKVTVSYTLDEVGDYEVIKLADGGMFSYTPNDDFVNEPWLYVKSYTNDQLVLMSYTATGNGGGSIAWQYILKRVK